MAVTSLRLSPLPGSKEGPHPVSAASVISRGTLRDHIRDILETEAQTEENGPAAVMQ